MADYKIVMEVRGFSKPISLRQISALQLRKCLRKGCKVYAIKVSKLLLNENPTSIRDHPVLNEFMDVFLEEIPILPPPREMDFSIEVIPWSAPASRVSYQMSIPK